MKDARLLEKRLITIGSVLEGRRKANIEDLFVAKDYLKIFNPPFKKHLTEKDLEGSDSITDKISRKLKFEEGFDHQKPADYLLRHRIEILPELSEETINNFEKLFILINKTMGINQSEKQPPQR